MPICMLQLCVQAKVTPGGKKNRNERKLGGGIIDMTRMQYVKGGMSIMAGQSREAQNKNDGAKARAKNEKKY